MKIIDWYTDLATWKKLGLIVLIVIFFNAARKSGTPSAEPAPVAVEAPSAEQGITMNKYNALRTGMSYREVATALGSEGKEMSSNEISGVKTVMYQWDSNSLGANMNAMFQNDKLVSKAQFGLK